MISRTSFLPALIWIIISTVLFILPGASLPKANWLDRLWFDKWVHIGIFIILVVLWCRALKSKFPSRKLKVIFLLTGLLALVYGAGMESVQHYFVTNRSFDVGDIVADAAGCVAGVVYSRRYIKK